MRDINLIPKEYLKKKKKPKIILLCSVSAMLTILLMAYIYILPLNNIRELEQEIKKFDEAIIDYDSLKGKISKMEEEEAIIEKKTEILNEICSKEVKPSKVFELVNGALPGDVWLTDLRYTFSDVSVTAVASSASEAAEFYVELSKNDEFKEIKLSPIEIDNNGYNFTIRFSLDAGSDDHD